MRKLLILSLTVMFMLSLISPYMAEAADFTLNRFVLCHKVEALEPVRASDSFDKDTEKVYVFIEVINVSDDTNIIIQWLYDGKETALIDLPIKKGNRWRTYSSKRIGIRYGKWEVRLLDNKGRLIEAQSFTVN